MHWLLIRVRVLDLQMCSWGAAALPSLVISEPCNLGSAPSLPSRPWRGKGPSCQENGDTIYKSRPTGAYMLNPRNLFDISTPPAKKTEPSNLVLRAQDHKKNPKFKGWQWDLKNPKFKIRSSKERRTKSEITEIVVEKYVFKIPKIQNFRNTRNQ